MNIDISSLDSLHRRAIEEVLGHELGPHQRLVIKVEEVHMPATASSQSEPQENFNPESGAVENLLPDYCNVYDGLTDEEIIDIESSILDRSPSR